MNEIALSVKRCHHGFLRITRRRLASVDLTAARFDMLYTVRRHGWALRREDPVKISQSDLRRALGVTATVVSRMVRALETLGLVTRHRNAYGDRRQIQVTLTKTGLQTLNRACKLLLRERPTHRLQGHLLRPPSGPAHTLHGDGDAREPPTRAPKALPPYRRPLLPLG